jgi:hypothetical protein
MMDYRVFRVAYNGQISELPEVITSLATKRPSRSRVP